MIEKLIAELLQWCEQNTIKINQIKDQLFEIPSFGKVFLMTPVDGKIVDAEMMFPMDENSFLQQQLEVDVEQKIFDYFAFQFGKEFYYCKPKLKVNSFNENLFVVDFTDLKYVGEHTLEIDVPVNHLSIHSEYDVLDGNGLKNYIKKGKFFGCSHLGICDKNTLAGVLAWQTECKKVEIKSVIGETISVAINYDPSIPDVIPITYEVKLYVTSFDGWQNLLQINKCINVDYPKFIPEAELLEYTKGLICICGPKSDLKFSEQKWMLKWLAKFKKFEGVYFQVDVAEYWDGSYDLLRLQMLNYYFQNYLKLIPPILLSDIYYCDKEQYIVKDYLNRVAKRAYEYSEAQWFKSFDEVATEFLPLFKDQDRGLELLTKMLENVGQVCQTCGDFEIETGKSKIPRYEFVEGESNEEFFYGLLLQGFKQKVVKLNKDVDVYTKRMEMEFNVILNAGFIDYFLILWDIVYWAKQNDIMVGPGRGSVGGSLLAYLLDITNIDPIEYNLMFERFINEARVSGERAKSADAMPDIDVDVMSEFRDVVKEYISQRFGELYTCSIGTFTNLQLKGGIKDFGGVKGLSFSYLNHVTKDISNQPVDYTFRDFVEYGVKSQELKKFFQDQPEIIKVIKWTLGQPKAASIHASAVIILPKEDSTGRPMNVFNWLPIRLMEGKYVSEWEGYWTDKFGTLKEDILGLSTLDKFVKALQLIKETKDKEIDLYKINFKDVKTYKIFQQGANEDIFQFNGAGMKNYSRKVKPDHFEDLIAMSALWRPGPMESNAHLDYALFKHGKKKPHFDFGLKSVTKDTQGLYIYQEQMMNALIVLGGFTAVQSDEARTMIKKFDNIQMQKLEKRFLDGAIKNGCPPKEADVIWKKLLAFSFYGFNRSHSAAYTMMSYQMQWLKANYPLEFWTTAISFAAEEEIPAMISEMGKLKQGVKIKPPSINNSLLDFRCDGETNNIYWGLSKIKGLGVKTAQHIINERDKNGAFKDYEEFINRVPKKEVNKGHLEKMIMAGVFDDVMGVHEVTERLDLMKLHCKLKKYDLPEEFTKVENFSKSYFWINKQKMLTGLGIVQYRQIISKLKQGKELLKIYKDSDTFFNECKDYDEVCIAGQVVELLEKRTRKGDDFILLKILSNYDLITMLIWQDFLQPNIEFLEHCLNKTICVTGKVRFDNWNSANAIHSSEETKFYYL